MHVRYILLKPLQKHMFTNVEISIPNYFASQKRNMQMAYQKWQNFNAQSHTARLTIFVIMTLLHTTNEFWVEQDFGFYSCVYALTHTFSYVQLCAYDNFDYKEHSQLMLLNVSPASHLKFHAAMETATTCSAGPSHSVVQWEPVGPREWAHTATWGQSPCRGRAPWTPAAIVFLSLRDPAPWHTLLCIESCCKYSVPSYRMAAI